MYVHACDEMFWRLRHMNKHIKNCCFSLVFSHRVHINKGYSGIRVIFLAVESRSSVILNLVTGIWTIIIIPNYVKDMTIFRHWHLHYTCYRQHCCHLMFRNATTTSRLEFSKEKIVRVSSSAHNLGMEA